MNENQKGHYHPLTIIIRDFQRIFDKMGFEVITGPELDTEHYNFNMLNVPPDHPARDMQDTFWIKDMENTVLRTQTSNMQIRYMEDKNNEPPIRVISPGRVFRNESTDARHEAVFHQIEGLAVDTDITMGDLKGVLEHGLAEFFHKDTQIRMRPGYFPFVEPGVEVDTTCFKCSGKDKSCPLCKGSGWIELMGAGMVHPRVLSNVGINPEKYQGFAFGVGVERLAMAKYGIDDVRLFSNGELRLVNQF